jgi:hypothetical protein
MSWSFNMGMKKSLLGFDAWAREASAIALAANVTISFACCAAAFTGPRLHWRRTSVLQRIPPPKAALRETKRL